MSQARERVALYVNQELTLLHWDIGQHIQTEIFKERRADYGQKIGATLSHQLTQEFGTEFTQSAITRMGQFAQAFPGRLIVVVLQPQPS